MFLGGTKALGADLRKNSRIVDPKLRSFSCSTVSLPHYLHLPRQVTLTSARLPLHQSLKEVMAGLLVAPNTVNLTIHRSALVKAPIY